MLKIGGCAVFNGIIMINASKGKVVKATRDGTGIVSINELSIFSKAMGFNRSKFGKLLYKVPVLRELYKVIIMLAISIFSIASAVVKGFLVKKNYTLKRAIVSLVFLLTIYSYLFLDEYIILILVAIMILFLKKEIASTLRYHGAEHKVVNMYENTGDVSFSTIETARGYSRIHLRCGTNIIVLLLPLWILYFIIGEYLVSMLGEDMFELGSIVLFVIAMEVFKFLQKPFMRKFLKPGMLMQRYITTKEPDDNQLEVAICALKTALED